MGGNWRPAGASIVSPRYRPVLPGPAFQYFHKYLEPGTAKNNFHKLRNRAKKHKEALEDNPQ